MIGKYCIYPELPKSNIRYSLILRRAYYHIDTYLRGSIYLSEVESARVVQAAENEAQHTA